MTFKDAIIGNIASVQTGPFGSQLHNKDYVLIGTPIVTVEHLGERKMTRQNLPCVSDADKERLFKYTLQYGDLVFSRVGSVDRCSWVSDDEDGWMFSGRCLRVRPNNPEEIYHKYLYYFFCLESTKDFVRNIAVGATMPSINTRLLSEVPISYPNIIEQRSIGDTLSALDDKIENNRKINHHLEQMAQAIFKSWFVEQTYDNWNYVELGSVTTEIRTKVKERQMQVLSAVRTGNLILSENYFTKQVYSKDIGKYIVVEPNDFAYNPARVNIGSLGINSFDFAGCVSPVYVVFRAEPEFHHFLSFFLKSPAFQEEVRVRASGSVRQSLNYGDFALIQVLYPSLDVVRRFNSQYEGILEAQNRIDEENVRLAELRDTLLPRLMSGEAVRPRPWRR
jgi:type I restriction enzyme S subunit